jgi:hypothetical protein
MESEVIAICEIFHNKLDHCGMLIQFERASATSFAVEYVNIF